MFTRLFLLTSVISILTFSCSPSKKEKTVIRYLAMGDSYTIGESVAESMRYPVQIADTLATLKYLVNDPEIIAVTGWTTGDLIEGIKRANPEGSYQLVTLLIGVNNQYQGLDINIYRSEFLELLDAAIAFAGGNSARVIVLSIPDWGVTPFAGGSDQDKIANEIDQYNEINKEITFSNNVAWVDVTEISRQAKEELSLLAEDGLHPSGSMYQAWVKVAMPEILRIIEMK